MIIIRPVRLWFGQFPLPKIQSLAETYCIYLRAGFDCRLPDGSGYGIGSGSSGSGIKRHKFLERSTGSRLAKIHRATQLLPVHFDACATP